MKKKIKKILEKLIKMKKLIYIQIFEKIYEKKIN